MKIYLLVLLFSAFFVGNVCAVTQYVPAIQVTNYHSQSSVKEQNTKKGKPFFSMKRLKAMAETKILNVWFWLFVLGLPLGIAGFYAGFISLGITEGGLVGLVIFGSGLALIILGGISFFVWLVKLTIDLANE